MFFFFSTRTEKGIARHFNESRYELLSTTAEQFLIGSFWACVCKLSWTLFSPDRVQPPNGAGRKESSGTGLYDTASRGTILLVFRMRMRRLPWTEILTIFVGKMSSWGKHNPLPITITCASSFNFRKGLSIRWLAVVCFEAYNILSFLSRKYLPKQSLQYSAPVHSSGTQKRINAQELDKRGAWKESEPHFCD